MAEEVQQIRLVYHKILISGSCLVKVAIPRDDSGKIDPISLQTVIRLEFPEYKLKDLSIYKATYKDQMNPEEMCHYWVIETF